MTSAYDRLRRHFVETGTTYREIAHPPAAAAAEYHVVVGSRLEQQAKALLFRRYRRSGGKDYVIYALPGNAEADIAWLGIATGGHRLRLATASELERQTACRFGELPPVGSIFDCELVLDERLLSQEELYFNACRLDTSFIVSPRSLVELERPLILAAPNTGDAGAGRAKARLPDAGR